MKKILKVSVIGFILAMVSLIILKVCNPNFGIISYISVLLDFFVAILTIFCVYTAFEQVKSTNLQLSQMEKEIKLQQQPFPYIEKCKFVVEKPRFFYTPPLNKYECLSRYRIIVDIKNITDEPAVLVDIVPSITLEDGTILKAVAERIEIMSSQIDNHYNLNFLVVGDEGNSLFKSLRENHADKYAKLNIDIYYKNVVDGKFKVSMQYYILPSEQFYSTILDWHTYISAFETKFYEELSRFRKVSKRNSALDKLFGDIKEQVQTDLGEQETCEFETLSISEKFNIEFLDDDKYAKETNEKVIYGKFLGRSIGGECTR